MYQNITRLIGTNYGTHRGFIRALLAQIEFLLGRLNSYIHPDATQVKRLVFVCLGNINRSAFAENVAKSLGVNTCSIGLSTQTGLPAFHMAVTTAAYYGFDLSSHQATNIADYKFRQGDLLLAMEIRHIHKLVALGIPKESISLLGYWAKPIRIHLHDPHTLSNVYFKTCFSLINSAVLELVTEMRVAKSPCVNNG